MKKILLGLCLAITLTLTACQPKEVEVIKEVEVEVLVPTPMDPIFTPGTYEAEALGRKGIVRVAVTFDETHITNVTVLEHRETKVVSDVALTQVPQEIVMYQTTGVDTVTGATFSSYAVKTAVANAIEMAGGNKADFSHAAAYGEVEKQQVTLDYDYAVAGGGLAGMMSALTAAEAGQKVVLFEEMGFLGGAMHCAAGVVAGLGTELYVGDPKGKYSSPEAYAADRWYNQNIMYADKALIPEWTPETTPMSYLMHSENTEMTQELIDRGVKFMGPTRSLSHVLGRGYFLGTSDFVAWLEGELEYNNVTIIKSTEVTEIMIEDGKTVGLKAEGKNIDYTVNAPAVLIATGGWNSNKDMVAENYPIYEGAASSSFYTADGSSIELGTEAGAGIAGMDLGFSQLWLTARGHIEIPFFQFFNTSLAVDAYGDDIPAFASYRDTCDMLLTDDQYGGYVYFMWDEAENPSILTGEGVPSYAGNASHGYPELYELGDVVEYESVQAMADALGLDDLVATIEEYNTAADAGEGVFGLPSYKVNKIEGKVYAMKVLPSIYVSYGGLTVDQDMRVLDTEGNVIEGLYAAGDAIGSPERQEGMKYTAGVTMAMSFGKVAAESMIEDKQ